MQVVVEKAFYNHIFVVILNCCWVGIVGISLVARQVVPPPKDHKEEKTQLSSETS